MPSLTPFGDTSHFFTVDVEEHFQVSAFDDVVSRDAWLSLPGRLDRSIPLLLDRLERRGAKGTFFTLGWVAKHRSGVVREIAAAGHEVASHGFWHRRVNTISPEEFREDIRSSKAALEDVTGTAVIGYRAPSFSIVPGCEWAFDVLLEEGYRYDSSIFPITRGGYGYPGAPRVPHLIERESGMLREFPMATTMFAGIPVPAAGGGYLRQFPFWIIQRAFAQASADGVPATFYIHPWEVDPDQPRMPVGLITRLRHYRGLSATLGRIERLLDQFQFTSIESFIEDTDRLTISQTYGLRG
jgi:polysaccharide deacetylase family protein (PEP-CTERM system associated)